MEDSILKTVRKICGVGEGDTSFDLDLLVHTNSALSTLHQLGLGPMEGFEITSDAESWDDLFGGDPLLNSIRTYICLRVRMYFDPPQTSYHISAINEQIKELEWRLNARREDALIEQEAADA